MKRFFYWVLTLLSAGALVSVVANIVLYNDNRAMQQEVGERQRYINEGVQLNQLNSQLIKMAAQTAASTGDEQLKNLLAENGITFEVTQQPVPASDQAQPEAQTNTGGRVMSEQQVSQNKPGQEKTEPSLLLPVSLAVIALLLMLGFQTSQLLREQQALQSNWDGQVTAHAEAAKLRTQFEAVASGAAKLADAGNQNASAIVRALNSAGVTIGDDKGDAK